MCRLTRKLQISTYVHGFLLPSRLNPSSCLGRAGQPAEWWWCIAHCASRLRLRGESMKVYFCICVFAFLYSGASTVSK